MSYTITQRAILASASYEACYMALHGVKPRKVFVWSHNRSERMAKYPYNPNRVLQNSAGPVTKLMIDILEGDDSVPYKYLIKERSDKWSNTPGRRYWEDILHEFPEGSLELFLAGVKIVQGLYVECPHNKIQRLKQIQNACPGQEKEVAFLFHLALRLKHFGYFAPMDAYVCGVKADLSPDLITYFEKISSVQARKIKSFYFSEPGLVPFSDNLIPRMVEKLTRLSFRKKKHVIPCRQQPQFAASHPFEYRTMIDDCAFALYTEVSEQPGTFLPNELFSKLIQRDELIRAIGHQV